MVRGGEVLLTMAEIAIGLAGFSGVVAAFSQTRDFPAADRVRFLMLVGGTFFVILLAFVPFMLELSGVEEPGLWRWSSAIWLAAFAVCSPLVMVGRRVILREGRSAPSWSLGVVFLIVLASCVAQVGNMIGWPYSSGPVPFLLGLMAGLIGSGSIFVYLVLIRPEP